MPTSFDGFVSDQNSAEDDPPVPILTNQQRAVLDALKKTQTDKDPLSDWYLGALYALNNRRNPDWLSQAAQSLRELVEKLPRVVSDMKLGSYGFKEKRSELHTMLSKDKKHYVEGWKGNITPHLCNTLKALDEYLRCNQQLLTRKERVEKSLTKMDPMSDQLTSRTREKKRESLHKLWGTLEHFAHHRSKSNVADFEKCLGELESMIFDLLASVTTRDQKEIRQILTRTAISAADKERILSLIERRGANFVFFFNELTDAQWLPVLKKRGYFSDLPKPEQNDDGCTLIPSWPPIFYLKKITETVPCAVVDTILGIPETKNPRILHEISEIALEVKPIMQSLRLKAWVLKYLRSSYDFVSSDFFIRLICRWATASKEATSSALALVKELVRHQSDPHWRHKQSFLGFQSRFNTGEYQEILKKGVQPLAEYEPYRTAEILIDVLANRIKAKFPQWEDHRDHSMRCCNRVFETREGYKDYDESLVHTLTFACIKVYEKAPKSVSKLDQMLQNQSWLIFDRIRQHLYAMFLNNQTMPWIRELILNDKNYSSESYPYEFQRMIRLASEKFGTELLTNTEREGIFSSILNGPSKQEFQDFIGKRYTEESFRARKDYFHRMKLRPFHSLLFGKYSDYFSELEDEKEPIRDDDYDPPISDTEGVFWSKESGKADPILIETLKKMQDKELLSFLNHQDDEHHESHEQSESLRICDCAQAFRLIFQKEILPDKRRLDYWLQHRDEIKRPVYMQRIIVAISECVEGRQFDKLEQGLCFSESVLDRPQLRKEKDCDSNDASAAYPDWHSARREVYEFVAQCLKADTPIWARNRLAALLDRLCIQYDWHLDEGKPVLQEVDEPLTEAINNTRSRALEGLVQFGFWVRRMTEDVQAETPEVMEVLEKRFSSNCDYPLTLPEHAILGRHYGNIWRLNEEWARRRKSDFFPQSEREKWKVAFDTFLSSNSLQKSIFDVLKDDIEFAIKNLKEFHVEANLGVGIGRKVFTHLLGEYLLRFYLLGVCPLRGENLSLEKFYKKTEEHRKYWDCLFEQAGYWLKNSKQIEDSVKERAITFFEWRLGEKRQSELKHFISWLEAGCLEAEWRLQSYLRVLGTFTALDRFDGYQEVRVLRAMLEGHTTLVVECFAKLAEQNTKSNCAACIPEEYAQPIIQAGLVSSNETVKTNATQARENLLKCGHSGLLDCN